MNKKELPYSALLILLSIVFSLIIVELGLRFFDLGYGHRPLEPHAVLHHVHPRSYSYVSHGPTGEFGDHQVFYDENGLVSDLDGAAEKESDCRIAFLGDSFTEARQVPYKKSFVGLLDSTTNCAVRNYGVSSYSPIFYYLQWVHAVNEWQPDIVVVQLYSNDMESDVNYFDQAELGPDGKPVAIPGSSGGWLVRQMRKSYVLRLLRKVQLTIEWTLDHWGQPKDVVGDFVEENPEISEVSADMLKALNDQIVEIGAELALTVVPSKYRLERIDRTFDKPEFADIWKEWAANKGIKYIDLARPFREARLRGGRLFFENDPHFNENGHSVVADTIKNAYPSAFDTD